MSGQGQRLTELRRSGAAGLHVDRTPRGAADRDALADQDAPDPPASLGWTCPRCQTMRAPRETPAGTFCSWCHLKLETCCEGAPLPERTTP